MLTTSLLAFSKFTYKLLINSGKINKLPLDKYIDNKYFDYGLIAVNLITIGFMKYNERKTVGKVIEKIE